LAFDAVPASARMLGTGERFNKNRKVPKV